MGFIAGYVSANRKYEPSFLEHKVKAYRILVEDDLRDYRTDILETKSGHLIQKYKKDYPIQTRPSGDEEGNSLLTLGFLRSKDKDAEGWLQSCTRSSGKALEQSEGEFVCVLAEGRSGQIHILNDRFASRPFYILKDPERIYFSSNLAFLLYLADGKREPDVLGWFQLFSCEHTLGARTTLRDVKRLKPATHLTISPDGALQERQYWRLSHQPELGLDPVSHSARVFEAFKDGAAFRARLAGKGVIALSGGLDSRLVAAVLPGDTEFTAFTFVNSAEGTTTSDTQAAAEVCGTLGLKQRVQPIAGEAFSLSAKDVVNLTGGLRPLQHMAIVMLYIRELKRTGLAFLLAGGPGDVIAGSKIPSPDYLDPRKTEECMRQFCRMQILDAGYLRLLFRDEVVRQSQQDLFHSLRESCDGLVGPTAAHKVTAWAMAHRWPAFTFTSVIHNHPDVTEAFCHLDYRFCDLMLKLPADWLYERQFYAFMIYHCLPHLRHVIYANTGKLLDGKLDSAFSKEKERLRSRAISILHGFARQVIPRPLVRLVRPLPKGTPSFNYALFRADKKLLAEMKETLEGSASMKELVDPERCFRFLKSFQEGDALGGLPYDYQTTLVGGLATMCLAFRHLRI